MNQVTLLGRLTKESEIRETNTGAKVLNNCIAIQRPYKNAEGEQVTDFVDITLWNNVAINMEKYCSKGDMVAIKGRLETNFKEKEDGKLSKNLNVVVEKVTFLEKNKEKFNTKER